MILDAVTTAVAEILAYVLGKVTGRALKLEKELAQRIGEYTILDVIAVAGTALALIYS